jgi:hypothetical protein
MLVARYYESSDRRGLQHPVSRGRGRNRRLAGHGH